MIFKVHTCRAGARKKCARNDPMVQFGFPVRVRAAVSVILIIFIMQYASGTMETECIDKSIFNRTFQV